MFIVWYPIEFSILHNLHPWYWNSLIRSHLLWGEFSAFSAAIAIHNSPLFIPPGTHHCWVDRGGMIWKACPTPLHMAGSVTRAPVTHPSTNRARSFLNFSDLSRTGYNTAMWAMDCWKSGPARPRWVFNIVYVVDAKLYFHSLLCY